jgi:hypothetical protein
MSCPFTKPPLNQQSLMQGGITPKQARKPVFTWVVLPAEYRRGLRIRGAAMEVDINY